MFIYIFKLKKNKSNPNYFIFILSTFQQLKNKFFLKKKAHYRSAALNKQPQARGTVKRARITTPRKPNSARRQTAKMYLSTKRWIVSFIPGIGHNIRAHSSVLVRGGGARDLPGVRYSCIRGARDFMGVVGKRYRRSIYGAKRPNDIIFKPRRKNRIEGYVVPKKIKLT